MSQTLGGKIELVGDDLFVTNVERIARGIQDNAANAILIKLNQIGTLSKTIAAIEMAYKANWGAMVSHRSGETVDKFIADLTVAMRTGQAWENMQIEILHELQDGASADVLDALLDEISYLVSEY